MRLRSGSDAAVTGNAGGKLSPLEEKLRMLPDRSGVYLFRDRAGRILYVGKAKRLPTRVRSYFRKGREREERLVRLVRRIADVETFVTGTETEALILEANLVRQHRPPFNIALKDDKSYPYLRVTVQHPFPGLTLTRRVVDDGSRYFGPYTHVKDLRRTLKRLRKVFPLRNCSDRRIESHERECLEYFIERCPAPCTGRIGAEAYRTIVGRLVRFLEGDVGGVIEEMRSQMIAHAEAKRFEEAARCRDDIDTLDRLVLRQRMTPSTAADTDIVAVVARGDRACGVSLHVRDGKVLGKEQRVLVRVRGVAAPEILRVFLAGSYIDAPELPAEIVTAFPPGDAPSLTALLTERAGRPVRIRTVRGGQLGRLVGLARENAHLRLEEDELRDRRRRVRVDPGVYNLQELVGLARTPYRIEGFDISNLGAHQAVASLVCFQDGIPLKSGYRRFRIKQVQGPDDVAMIGEVLHRRLQRLRSEGGQPPDLILIDGGIGQVGRASEVLAGEGYGEVPLLGLAKREELVVIPGRPDPLRLPRSSPALRLLQRVRDEAHRFAVGYHRKLRSKDQVRSGLDPLPGIGPRRRILLLRHFGSLEGIRRASPESLGRVPGIGPRTIERILGGLGKEMDVSDSTQGDPA
jgi:excinuclease ABC subunit C